VIKYVGMEMKELGVMSSVGVVVQCKVVLNYDLTVSQRQCNCVIYLNDRLFKLHAHSVV